MKLIIFIFSRIISFLFLWFAYFLQRHIGISSLRLHTYLIFLVYQNKKVNTAHNEYHWSSQSQIIQKEHIVEGFVEFIVDVIHQKAEVIVVGFVLKAIFVG